MSNKAKKKKSEKTPPHKVTTFNISIYIFNEIYTVYGCPNGSGPAHEPSDHTPNLFGSLRILVSYRSGFAGCLPLSNTVTPHDHGRSIAIARDVKGKKALQLRICGSHHHIHGEREEPWLEDPLALDLWNCCCAGDECGEDEDAGHGEAHERRARSSPSASFGRRPARPVFGGTGPSPRRRQDLAIVLVTDPPKVRSDFAADRVDNARHVFVECPQRASARKKIIKTLIL